MKRFKKILKWTGIVLLLLISGLLITVYARQNLKFDAPYPDIHASTDSAVIERGKYLVFGPAHCASCHANKDELALIRNNGAILPLAGGLEFDLGMCKITTPNLTPDPETGVGKVTDPEIARALRYGVGHDGRAMLDFMSLHDASDEDLTAVISYLRSMKSVKREIPKPTYNLMGKAIKAFLIKPVGPLNTPPKAIEMDSSEAYGRYFVMISNCRGCHTPRGMTGDFIGPDFSGGVTFEEKGGTFVSPNLTADKETGWITDWSEQTFIERFKKGRNYENSPMPWESFKSISETDLKAVYRYIRSLKPVPHKIDKVFTPAAAIKLSQESY